MFTGNRGILHDEHGEIKRQWKLKAWITCLLEFKGRKRQIFSPGSYRAILRNIDGVLDFDPDAPSLTVTVTFDGQKTSVEKVAGEPRFLK